MSLLMEKVAKLQVLKGEARKGNFGDRLVKLQSDNATKKKASDEAIKASGKERADARKAAHKKAKANPKMNAAAIRKSGDEAAKRATSPLTQKLRNVAHADSERTAKATRRYGAKVDKAVKTTARKVGKAGLAVGAAGAAAYGAKKLYNKAKANKQG